MAKMNGCNEGFHKMQKAQGVNTITPGKFARNNLSKGGVNNMMLGKADKPSVKAGGAHKGKHTHMPKGY